MNSGFLLRNVPFREYDLHQFKIVRPHHQSCKSAAQYGSTGQHKLNGPWFRQQLKRSCQDRTENRCRSKSHANRSEEILQERRIPDDLEQRDLWDDVPHLGDDPASDIDGPSCPSAHEAAENEENEGCDAEVDDILDVRIREDFSVAESHGDADQQSNAHPRHMVQRRCESQEEGCQNHMTIVLEGEAPSEEGVDAQSGNEKSQKEHFYQEHTWSGLMAAKTIMRILYRPSFRIFAMILIAVCT